MKIHRIALKFAITIPVVALLTATSLAEHQTEVDYTTLVREDQPVVWWRGDGSHDGIVDNAAPGGMPLPAHVHGKISFPGSGPTADEFIGLPADNVAIKTGRGAWLKVTDPGDNSPLDFSIGDAITLEAWVKPSALPDGQQVYLVGKGRTGNSGFSSHNQNYALRLKGQGGSARLSFLFRSQPGSDGPQDSDWHRWTSDSGFAPGGSWHHVAVTFEFGRADSVRGYIDGLDTTGTWDMGGASAAAPIVDNDELWIGSSMSGNASSTLNGQIDEVAIYRTALSADRIGQRCHLLPPDPLVRDDELPNGAVLVEILEGVPDRKSWDFRPPKVVDRYQQPSFVFLDIAHKYSERGVQIDRAAPFLVRATGLVELPPGQQQILLRSRHGARLSIDGDIVVETPFFNISSSAHGTIRHVEKVNDPDLHPLGVGDSENVSTINGDGQQHRVQLDFFVGGGGRRPETGETCVALRPAELDSAMTTPWTLLGPDCRVTLTDTGWYPYVASLQDYFRDLNRRNRLRLGAAETEYWSLRHALARQDIAHREPISVPQSAPGAPSVSAGRDERTFESTPSAQDTTPAATSSPTNPIDRFISHRLQLEHVAPTESLDDLSFLRRVTLDTIGTIPTPEQINAFLDAPSAQRRSDCIDRLLEHPRGADHQVSYWQDVLAENPNLVNPTLNNTGPFRWWIHESFSDNKPFDQFVTELIMMEGSTHYGGPGGFSMATQNDAPLAAKAHIVGQAFLGLEMQCARCHDAPYHPFAQKDLFSVAAMLNRAPQSVPKTSTVPIDPEAAHQPRVQITLKPGESIDPAWPFENLAAVEFADGVLRNSDDSRERLAALITSPANDRFAQVIVNRIWKRLIGRAFVEPVDDWKDAEPSHPDLLAWLGRELVANNYDLRHITRLILNTSIYQRQAVDPRRLPADESYVFQGPARRRMSAEQIVDTIFTATGKEFHAGDMNIDADGARASNVSLNLGTPSAAWQFTSLSNERDRPSLALPLAQGFIDLLETYGWRGSRQNAVSVRDHGPTVLQPGVMTNGILGRRFTRLSDDSAFTELALVDLPLETLIDSLFLRTITRHPSSDELNLFVELLTEGFSDRRIVVDRSMLVEYRPRNPGVSWSNHLSPEASDLKIAMEQQVRAGDPPSIRLQPDWRERLEDMLWTVLNSPEFVFIP